ncbi:MAG TPA: AgmX/PglI C-terminal domain-containing protein [Labilithrix sp.]|nr:AgmX/PglI C-terminal domain-containing protein [Labilithrix sp.]
MRLVAALLLVASACGAEVRPGVSTRSKLGAEAGLSRDAVDAVVRGHVPAIRACYEAHATAEGRPMGVVRVGWRVEPSGAVASVEIVATTLHSTSIEGCITSEIARWQFPASSRSTEVAEHPFTF